MRAFWAFLDRFPSPVVEFVGGLLCVLFGMLCENKWGPYAVLFFAHALSAVYETLADPNGFSWEDVRQRELGILVGLFLWARFL